jgi:DNA topoisomerase-1
MTRNLIIVESPGKIKTLSKFLGKDFVIEASKGHVIDLPPSRFGVSTENGFVPDYHVVKDRKEVILRLQKVARGADRIYLAPDPDREGEAISWHLANVLNIDPLSDCRITFNSITREDVLKSLQQPRSINFPLVNAQQSRRILDRLVGYRLSPLLWQKICLGLSAGRVQSVAVALICQREKEILAFIPEEFWTISAEVKNGKNKKFLVKTGQM